LGPKKEPIKKEKNREKNKLWVGGLSGRERAFSRDRVLPITKWSMSMRFPKTRIARKTGRILDEERRKGIDMKREKTK